MMKQIIFLTVALTFFIPLQSKSQGCSDAGFCTMGTLKPQSETDTVYRNSASLAFSFGIGEQKTKIIQLIPELVFGIFKNNSLQLKIPFVSVSGNLGSNSGVGDFSVSTTQTMKETENTKLNLTVGFKFPTGDASDVQVAPTDALLPLPMPYQISLGTTDLILGASMNYKKWNFALGFQKILADGNENKFLRSTWRSIWADNVDAQKYFDSNLLERGNDALVRIEKSFQLKKVNFSIGVLNIIHLNPSSIVDSTGTRVEVKGSDGLTVNVTGNMIYEISKRTLLNFSFGVPTIVRDARPDGLTRKLVLTAGLNFRFGN